MEKLTHFCWLWHYSFRCPTELIEKYHKVLNTGKNIPFKNLRSTSTDLQCKLFYPIPAGVPIEKKNPTVFQIKHMLGNWMQSWLWFWWKSGADISQDRSKKIIVGTSYIKFLTLLQVVTSSWISPSISVSSPFPGFWAHKRKWEYAC